MKGSWDYECDRCEEQGSRVVVCGRVMRLCSEHHERVLDGN